MRSVLQMHVTLARLLEEKINGIALRTILIVQNPLAREHVLRKKGHIEKSKWCVWIPELELVRDLLQNKVADEGGVEGSPV